MEVGGEGDYIYTYRYTVTTRITSALRWAAMRAILMFHHCEGQSRKTVSADFTFTEIIKLIKVRGPTGRRPRLSHSS